MCASITSLLSLRVGSDKLAMIISVGKIFVLFFESKFKGDKNSILFKSDLIFINGDAFF